MNYINKTEIINLIKSGFDIELISMEFDISMDDLRKLEDEIKGVNRVKSTKLNTSIENIDYEERNSTKHSSKNSLKIMRGKYYFLYNDDKIQNPIQEIKLSDEEKEKIQTTINDIEIITSKFNTLKYKEQRECVKKTIDILNRIKNYPLSIMQAEKLINIFKTLKEIKYAQSDRLIYLLNRSEFDIRKKHALSIDILISKTENIEELISLRSRISTEMISKNQLLYGTLKNKINNKILNIRQRQTFSDIREKVPEEINMILNDLLNGKLDLERAENTIYDLAKKSVKNTSANEFSLTEEQKIKQIRIQIQILLKEKSSVYKIKNPKETMKYLQNLCRISEIQSLNLVVDNLLDNLDFENAKNICKTFETKNMEEQSQVYLLQRRIRYAEISNMVLKAIKEEGFIKDEEEYFNMIKKGIISQDIKFSSISLGKTKSGLRTITLADVWPEKIYARYR